MRRVLVVCALASCVAGVSASRHHGEDPPSPAGPQSPPPARVVEVVAERFSFTPSEIRVPAGTPLQIRLKSDDTAHGFHIVGTDVDIEIPKRGRGTTTVTFVPQEGRYVFECSTICGAGHEFMRGVIVATPPEP